MAYPSASAAQRLAHGDARQRRQHATASRPARRDTALFTPDATPAMASLTLASTAAVSGATVSAMPRPNVITAGRTLRRTGRGASRLNRSMPSAATRARASSDPGPMRWLSCPALGDRKSKEEGEGEERHPGLQRRVAERQLEGAASPGRTALSAGVDGERRGWPR